VGYREDGVVNESARGRPAAALRPYIAQYTGYRQAGVGPARHRGLPSPYLTLIFALDEPLTVAAHPDPAQPPGEYAALLRTGCAPTDWLAQEFRNVQATAGAPVPGSWYE
jgi:hypothetical protein